MRREAPPSREPCVGRPSFTRVRGHQLVGLLGRAAVLLLIVVSASAAVTLNASSPESSHLLVGDLKVSDSGEGPSDRVSGTFTGLNMAPGDQVEERLTVLREPPPDPMPEVLEPTITVRFEETKSQGTLAASLLVETLSYDGADLVPAVEDSCGAPVTLEVLFECTRQPPHPLHGLTDPTPEGRDLWLGVVALEGIGQGGGTGFHVNVTLHGRTVAEEDDPPSFPVGGGSTPGLDGGLGEEPLVEASDRFDAGLENTVSSLAPDACGVLVLGEEWVPEETDGASWAGVGPGGVGVDVLLDTGFGALCDRSG